MKTTLIGLFSQSQQVSHCVYELERKGIDAKHMSLITSDKIDKDSFEITSNTKIPEAAGVGAIAGGGLGLVVGGLAAVGSVATGGIGLLASGPVVAALTAGAFGAGGGGMLGAVIGTTMPDADQQAIIDEIEKGASLLCVECGPSETTLVKNVMKSSDAKKVESIDHQTLKQLQNQ